MTADTHSRVVFQLESGLDDVPVDAVAALAGTAQALLRHCEEHAGGPATLRAARLGPLLNLWLVDPACSPACLFGSSHWPTAVDQHDRAPGDVRLAVDPGPGGGLRLHWALVWAEESSADSLVPS